MCWEMGYKNLYAGNYTCCVMKNWFEGKCCKILLWGEKDSKGCEIQLAYCFTAKVTFVPRAVFYSYCKKSNPSLQAWAVVLVEHEHAACLVLLEDQALCRFPKIDTVLFLGGTGKSIWESDCVAIALWLLFL